MSKRGFFGVKGTTEHTLNLIVFGVVLLVVLGSCELTRILG